MHLADNCVQCLYLKRLFTFYRLEALVSQLRFWMTKQRVHKTLQQLPATSYERLPILFDLNKHPLKGEFCPQEGACEIPVPK